MNRVVGAEIEHQMARPVRRKVTIVLGDLSLESFGEALPPGSPAVSASLMQAIRYYLAEQDSGRPGWAYPSFLRAEDDGKTAEVEVEIDDSTWDEFAREADRQDVSTARLLQHAALYFMADSDSGRLTQRIVEDLAEPGP
jgi:hypothetical protein